MTPRQDTLFSSVPHSNYPISVLDPWRPFLCWQGQGALQGHWAVDTPCALLPELQRHKDNVMCAVLAFPLPASSALNRYNALNRYTTVLEGTGGPLGPPLRPSCCSSLTSGIWQVVIINYRHTNEKSFSVQKPMVAHQKKLSCFLCTSGMFLW